MLCNKICPEIYYGYFMYSFLCTRFDYFAGYIIYCYHMLKQEYLTMGTQSKY